ncbi:hypothetical protein A9995_04865 [Erythrobacter sp. QSSC1-22B]|nr:hypothetical protein A9995_04865 [Erythrobacter sp. QSSC1-22B]
MRRPITANERAGTCEIVDSPMQIERTVEPEVARVPIIAFSYDGIWFFGDEVSSYRMKLGVSPVITALKADP